jgi:gliding motility-associated-like protein
MVMKKPQSTSVALPHFYTKLLHRFKRQFLLRISRSTSTRQKRRFFRRFEKAVLSAGYASDGLRKSVVAAGLAIALATGYAHAQNSPGPFEKQRRAFNPFREPINRYNLPVPQVVDMDGDNDFDLLIGSIGGDILTFINEGTVTQPRFSNITELGNDPLGSIFVGTQSTPAAIDYDGDGDIDLFVGSPGSVVRYYRNESGSYVEQTGTWNPTTKTGNPFLPFDLQRARVTWMDWEGDGDKDALVGGAFFPAYQLFLNNGSGTLTQEPITFAGSLEFSFIPSFAFGDMDGDGDRDMVIGEQEEIWYYRNNGSNVFTEQTGPWNPTLKTGNPFFDVFVGELCSPQLADFDNDGDLDAIIGYSFADDPKTGEDESGGGIHYFINTGNGVFKEQFGFDNPLDGISVIQNAASTVADFNSDGDLDILATGFSLAFNGEEEVLMASQRFYSITASGVIENDSEDPFSSLFDEGIITPVDFDKDGDMDAFLLNDGFTKYFRNDNQTMIEVPGHPLANLPVTIPFDYPVSFINLDNDNDWDIAFFNGSNGFTYLKNTGTSAAAVFEETSGAQNILAGLPAPNTSGLRVFDVDGDGDLDAFTDSVDPDQVFFHENTGTVSNPVFGPPSDLFADLRESHASVTFFDFDGDGDNDVLAGTDQGVFKFLRNNNPRPQVTVQTGQIVFEGGLSSDFIQIDPGVILSDSDNDKIVRATIAVEPYEAGKDNFAFSPPGGFAISGSFNSDNGVYTLEGSLSVAQFQEALRNVRYRYSGTNAGGRQAAARTKNINKTFTFNAFDSDRTLPAPAILSAVVNFTNLPPLIDVGQALALKGQSAIVIVEFTDPDGNLDPSSFRVVTPPASGARVQFTNGFLVVDYSQLNFVGTETFVIEICDLLGACVQETITVTVQGEVELVVYNGISADGNGQNEIFRIENIESQEPSNKVSIYSRWGDKVFEMDDYDNTTRKFEGLTENGKKLPAGTYFYKVDFRSGRKSLSGYLYLRN